MTEWVLKHSYTVFRCTKISAIAKGSEVEKSVPSSQKGKEALIMSAFRDVSGIQHSVSAVGHLSE